MLASAPVTHPPEHECLDEEQALCLVQGKLIPERLCILLGHVERCPDCDILVREAGRALRSLSRSSLSDDSASRPVLFGGNLVAGRYEIERVLGRGGMGIVHQAYDTELQERVALKTIRTHGEQGKFAVSRLKRELMFARRVVHPNVCRVLEFGKHEVDERICHFFTMEYLDGEPLARLIARRGRLTVDEALEIGCDLASGLAAIHACGVLHRDIKSSNVMMLGDDTTEKRAILVDFGIAQSPSESEAFGVPEAPAGTPHYMAPEQARPGQIGTQADVYSLGVVLFEMLTGRLPSGPREEAPQRPATALLRAPLEKLGVPAAFSDLVCACLSRDPGARPTSGEELAACFLQLTADVLEEPSLSSGASRRPWPSRRSFASALLLTVGVIGLTFAWPSRSTHVRNVEKIVQRNAARQAPDLPSRAPSEVPPGTSSSHRTLAVGAEKSELNARGKPYPRGQPSTSPADAKARRSPQAPSSSAASLVGASAEALDHRCSPPYFYDQQGFRVYRKECLE